MSVGSIDHHGVRSGAHQHLDSVESIRLDTDCSSYEKATLAVLGCYRIVLYLHQILVGDEAYDASFIVHHRKFLNLRASENAGGILEADALPGGNEILGSHHLGNRPLLVILETEVAVGDNADEIIAAVHYRNAADMVLRHKSQRFSDIGRRADGDRVVYHAVLGSLDPSDLLALSLDGHVLVNHADTSGTGHRYGQVRLGHGIHRR